VTVTIRRKGRKSLRERAPEKVRQFVLQHRAASAMGRKVPDQVLGWRRGKRASRDVPESSLSRIVFSAVTGLTGAGARACARLGRGRQNQRNFD